MKFLTLFIYISSIPIFSASFTITIKNDTEETLDVTTNIYNQKSIHLRSDVKNTFGVGETKTLTIEDGHCLHTLWPFTIMKPGAPRDARFKYAVGFNKCTSHNFTVSKNTASDKERYEFLLESKEVK